MHFLLNMGPVLRLVLGAVLGLGLGAVPLQRGAAVFRDAAAEAQALRTRVEAMFDHAYDNYRAHAFPLDELAPLSCRGRDTWMGEGNMLTLVDTLDMLVILDRPAEFCRCVPRVVLGLSYRAWQLGRCRLQPAMGDACISACRRSRV